MRTLVKKIGWSPDGVRQIQFSPVDTQGIGKDWFDLRVWGDTHDHRSLKPFILTISRWPTNEVDFDLVKVFRSLNLESITSYRQVHHTLYLK
jgi:hypothetical protein